MSPRTRKAGKGMSLAKGPVALLGALMLAYGIVAFLLGGNSFGMDAPSGDVGGDSFLGIEGNGWTNLLWAASGALLLFGSPFHWGAKTTALVVGLVLGAASVIAMFDGFAEGDVLGIFATDSRTILALGVASAILLIMALLPRVGRKDARATDHDDRHEHGHTHGHEHGHEHGHAHDHEHDRHEHDRHEHDRREPGITTAGVPMASGSTTGDRPAEPDAEQERAHGREHGGRFERTGGEAADPQIAASRDAERGDRR